MTEEDRSAGRWCSVCSQHGSHHTDRHDQHRRDEPEIWYDAPDDNQYPQPVGEMLLCMTVDEYKGRLRRAMFLGATAAGSWAIAIGLFVWLWL